MENIITLYESKTHRFEYPSLLIITGTHGDETNAVMLGTRLQQSAESIFSNYSHVGLLSGWNMLALAEGSRNYPKKEKELNMNRAFEESNDWYNYEKSLNKVKALVEGYDIIIDVHNSPNLNNCVIVDNNLYAEKYVRFCKKNDIFCVLRDTSIKTIKKYANDKERVGFTVEINGMGYTDAETRKNNMKFLENFISKVYVLGYGNKTDENRMTKLPYENEMIELKSHCNGIVEYAFDDMSREFKKDETLAYISSEAMFNKTFKCKEIIVAPCDGRIIDFENSLFAVDGKCIIEYQPNINI